MNLVVIVEQQKLKFLARITLIALAAFVCVFGRVTFAANTQDEDSHPGYLSDVSEERGDPSHEFVIMPLTDPADKVKLIDKIFTEKLKLDLIKQYRETFGYTEYEQINNTSSRFTDAQSADSNRLTSTDDFLAKQNQFGNYMMKKMAEYHVDNYMKSNHDLKAVYETKQKLSNIEYKTSNGSKLKMRYDLASNTATFSLEKPEERFHKSIDVKLTSTAPNTIARASYDITKVLRIESNYGIEQEISTLILSRRLAPNLMVSMTAQSLQKDIDALTPQQNRLLLGMSWND